MDADLISLDTSNILNTKDKNELMSIVENKSKVRILNDELESLQQRTNPVESVKSIPSKRYVISDIGSDDNSSSLISSKNPSDEENDMNLKYFNQDQSHAFKKSKPVPFFSNNIPEVETMNIDDVVVGEKKPFKYKL